MILISQENPYILPTVLIAENYIIQIRYIKSIGVADIVAFNDIKAFKEDDNYIKLAEYRNFKTANRIMKELSSDLISGVKYQKIGEYQFPYYPAKENEKPTWREFARFANEHYISDEVSCAYYHENIEPYTEDSDWTNWKDKFLSEVRK